MLRDNATTGPGFVSRASVLDGIGDFVEVSHDPALNVGTGDFTVDLWVNFNSTVGEQILIEKYIENFSPTPPGWFLTKFEDNSLRFGTGPADSGHGVTSSALSLPANTWIHFAARRSCGVAGIFVNGTLVASGTFLDNSDSTSSLKFGHRGDQRDTPGSTDDRGFFLNGLIDEVELFVGHALSDGEILALYNAGAAGKCTDQPVRGSVTGVTPRRVVCINVTRRQTVQIQDGATSWNCEGAGLVVNPGDKILLTILGRAD